MLTLRNKRIIFIFFTVILTSRIQVRAQITNNQNLSDQVEVKKWLAENPNVSIIPIDYFLSSSEKTQNQFEELENKMICVGNQPTLQEIQNYQLTGEGVISISGLLTEIETVKKWKLENQDVLLISRVDYQQLNSEDAASINKIPFKIIYTKHLRLSDIEAYQSFLELLPYKSKHDLYTNNTELYNKLYKKVDLVLTIYRSEFDQLTEEKKNEILKNDHLIIENN